MAGLSDPRIKVVETSIVTDEELERLINEWLQKGYRLDKIDYVSSPASRRPQMAFLFFERLE